LVLDGLSAPALLFAATQSPLLQTANQLLGLNPEITNTTCALTFVGPAVNLQRLNFVMGGLKFDFAGVGSLVSRSLQLSGDARPDHPAETQLAPGQPAPGPTYVPIHIDGPIGHLTATFDAERNGTPPQSELPTGTLPRGAGQPD
jgi:hypothetical protein